MKHNRLVWWHFSDLHWDLRSSTERRAFLTVLHDDLRARVLEFGPPDFVAFTGDVSYSGEEAQYLSAERDFFTPIRTAVNPTCPFFFVPGNHDIRRPVAKTVNPELILSLNSTRSLNEFLDVDDYVQMIRRPFSAFDAFMSRSSPGINVEPMGWWTTLTLRDASILLIGLNSAWASSYHKTSEGTIEDERHLLIGQRQLLTLTESKREALSVVLLHHPLKWLNGFCETQLRQLLQRHADFVLFGHTHALHDLSQTLGAAGSTVFLPAPAIYDRAPTDTVEYARGYNIVQFDLETRRGSAHYYKYSDAYVAKFHPFVELYPGKGQEDFPIDLSGSLRQATPEPRPRFQSFTEALSAFPQVASINRYLESAIEASSFERHTVEYYESVVLDVVRESDIVDQDLAHFFWEAAVLSRALLYCDLAQLASNGTKPYLYKYSVDQLCSHLADHTKNDRSSLQLSVDDYRRLFALSFDACSFNAEALAAIPEAYRRLFALPWALSRLLMYLDYPGLIPHALRSEGRIANLYSSGKPEELSIMSCRFDAKRSLLSIDLRVQEKSGFLAVTLLKHYFDIAIRQAADFWRQSQRVLPPLTLLLDFPRWRNKRVNAYELTVETTPIVRLLMGRAMYRDAHHVWFRELLQNALDATSARRALDGPDYASRLDIALHGPTTCTIRDNGIGMSQQHILLYLTRLGRSIWNSEELKTAEETETSKKRSRETTLRAIGKFGIGFAAVFQDAERVIVRTRFFREIGEVGWVVDFTSVEKPFLLEAADVPTGTEIEVQLRNDREQALSPARFISMVNEFFLYIDENITISPDPKIAHSLADVQMVEADKRHRLLLRDSTMIEHVGPYSFRLRCVFGFDFRQKEKDDRPPPSYLLVSNAGVRVFQQQSLLLKPGKQYVLLEESDRGTTYEDSREHGIQHYWIVVDFDKGASPILPSRLEIDINADLAKQILELVQKRFCEALRSVAEEILGRTLDSRARRKALMNALLHSTENYHRYRRWRDDSERFCNVKTIEEAAVEVYLQAGEVCIQTAEGEERYASVKDLQKLPAGVFVSESVTKSPLFKVYAKAMSLQEWVIVEGHREYALFSKAIGSIEWRGFAVEKDIYEERMRVFKEVTDSPLSDIVRGDYAVIADQIFGSEAFVVLPSNIPGSWKRGEAAGYVRSAVMSTCPPRVLINPRHQLYRHLAEFASKATSKNSLAELRELKLLLDSLSDGVIENDRVTVARERWRTIQRELRELLGGKLPEMAYEALVARRH